MILGTKRRGNPGERFDHETGEGYVAQRDGDYVDARPSAGSRPSLSSPRSLAG